MMVWILGSKSVVRASILHQPDDIGSQRHQIVPIGELNGVLIALVAGVSLRRLRYDSVTILLTLSLVHSDCVARNCDAVSSHLMKISSDEEIMLMCDIQFSEEQPQATSTSRRYKKISMTGCVLFLSARDAPALVDQYVTKPIKSHVKVTSCVLALRAVTTPDVDVGSSSIRRKST
ncbi:hypothetical protein Tco_0179726 [Tanacetum coccineum]